MILNLEEKNLAGQEKKIYSDLTFSQYIHIQNFEEKNLFQHFANLIKIRSTHLLPILDLIIPPLPEGGGGYTVLPLSVRPSKIFFVTFFSATIDGRNLIFGHKLHIGMPYRGKRFWNHQIPTSCLPTWLVFIHIEHICTFFSTTIDGRNLVFGHKLHIGTPYHGKWQGYHK